MLWTTGVIFGILWLLGFVSGYTMGGFIHILLIVVMAAVLIRVFLKQDPFSRLPSQPY